MKLELESCLRKIAELFAVGNITYGVGASMLLYFKGLEAEPRDLDLIVALEDATKADKILSVIGEKQAPNPNVHYSTRFFGEYVIDGIDVDVMAGFKIKSVGKEVEYILDSKVLESLDSKGVTIWLCPLEDWFVLYLLMPNRQERASTIHDFFLEHDANLSQLEVWLQKGLPSEIKTRLQELLKIAKYLP